MTRVTYDGSRFYPSYAPLVLYRRVRHRLRGPQDGCSCSRCFNDPRRRVPASEVYEARQELARLRAAGPLVVADAERCRAEAVRLTDNLAALDRSWVALDATLVERTAERDAARAALRMFLASLGELLTSRQAVDAFQEACPRTLLNTTIARCLAAVADVVGGSVMGGTVIESGRNEWHRLARESGDADLLARALAVGDDIDSWPTLKGEILAAFNAAALRIADRSLGGAR